MDPRLIGYCYRMLGSPFDAEDAVRETLVRPNSNRLQVFTVATRICLRGSHAGVRPIPDSWLDPAERRETIRLAFITALQRLPPRQRAVLILRDVLGWKTSEVAVIIDATVASVNSALQRARATMRAIDPRPVDRAQHGDLLARYAEAFERNDMATLVSLLHEDARIPIPPAEGDRLVLVMANGSTAFGQYRPGPSGRLEPFALHMFEVAGGLIAEVTTYLDAARLFPLFGLTNEFPGSDRY